MQEGFQRLESEHPHEVIKQVNAMAAALDLAGGFRFSIAQKNFASVIEIESGELTPLILQQLHALALGDTNTNTEVDKRTNTITVELAEHRIH